MYIFHPKFAFSVISDRSGDLVVRSRNGHDLIEFCKLYGEPCELEVLEGVGTDYPFRVYMTRFEFAHCMSEAIKRLTYTNVKGAVNPSDPRHDLMFDLWTAYAANSVKE